MKILSIETSCDESATSLVEANGGLENPQFKVISSALNSQVDLHKEFGGVYPSLAKREHAKNLVPLLEKILKNSGLNKQNKEEKEEPDFSEEQITEIGKILEREPELLKTFLEIVSKLPKPDIEHIAVTIGPGLEPALWVGINFAKALSLIWNVPVIPVDHMEGHVASVLIENKVEFPAIALLVSGGHTDLYCVKKWGDYKHLGGTRDDAVGEAFDKVARLLNLDYPGGPEISKLSEKERSRATKSEEKWDMPRPMAGSNDLDFSFSGIKTHVLYLTRDLAEISPKIRKSVAREFEDAVIDVLVSKTSSALEKMGADSLIVAGGVAANKELRRRMGDLASSHNIPLLLPPQDLSTDNATMIAFAGYLKLQYQKEDEFKINPELEARGNLEL